MPPKSKLRLAAEAATLLGVAAAGGAAAHAGIENTDALSCLNPLVKELLAVIIPVLLAWFARGPNTK